MLVRFTTNHGTFEVTLDPERAPITVENFVQYVRDGFYNGTVFHRVIANFMIQGGGMDAELKQKPTRASIQNESGNGLSNVKGSIAMARTSAPHSASAQFFINVTDNTFLDKESPRGDGWGYCVFGAVTNGMDVVEAIKAIPTGNRSGYQDVPTRDVVIEEAVVVE